MIRNFAKHMSVGHFVKAARAKYLSLSLFWLSIFAAFCALTIYQLTLLGIDLNRNDKVTRLKLQRQFPMKFPAVTVCNLNPYKMSSVQSLPEFQTLIDVAKNMPNRQKRSAILLGNTNNNGNEHLRKKRQSSNNCPHLDQQKYYKIRNVNTSKVVSINETMTAMSNSIEIPFVQTEDNNSTSQQWYFVPTSSDNTSFYIYNRDSNKVLTYIVTQFNVYLIYDKPCNLKNQSFNIVPTSLCQSYYIIPSDMTNYYLGNINYDLINTYTGMQTYNTAASTTNNEEWTFVEAGDLSVQVKPICQITENPAICLLSPDPNSFYKIIFIENQKLLGINGSSLVPGMWIYQNDDNANYAQEWAFQLSDPTNNTYRIYNRNSRLAMRWTEIASQSMDNSGSLFQDNLDCNSKYEIFRLIQSSISGSCMLALDTANGTSYVTASASCKVVKDMPAEGFPVQQSQPTCQWLLLQKTDSIPSSFNVPSCMTTTRVTVPSSSSSSTQNVPKNFTCENGTVPDTNKFYKLRNVFSSKVASWNYSVLLNGVEMPFVQNDDVGSIYQHWYLVPTDASNKKYYIYNRGSKKALTYLPDPNYNYIYEKPCNLKNQSFTFDSATFANQSCYINSLSSSIYLTVNGYSSKSNANLLMMPYDSSGVLSYKWVFLDTGDTIQDDFQTSICNITTNPNSCELNPDPSKFYNIIFLKNQKYLDITNNSLANGSKAQQNDETGQPSQQWVFQQIDATSKSYVIYNRNSQMVLTYGPNWTADGNIFQSSFDCSNSSFQQFNIVQNSKGSCNISATSVPNWFITGSDNCHIVLNQHSTMQYKFVNYTYPYAECQNLILQEAGDVPVGFNFALCGSSTTQLISSTSSSSSVISDTNQQTIDSTPISSSSSAVDMHATSSVKILFSPSSSSSSTKATTTTTTSLTAAVPSTSSATTEFTTGNTSSSTSSTSVTTQEKVNFITNILTGLITLNNTDPVSQNTILLEALPYLTTSMTEQERSDFSYQLLDMLSHCTFNNQNCDIKNDLVQWNDITVGNCFTFNHRDAVNQHYTTQAGPAMGLKLLFKVNQNDYLPTTQTSGIRVFIHDQDQTVFPETEGYTVSGSFTAEFSMNYQEIKRTAGNCIATTDLSNYYYDGNYSNEEGCIRTCYQKAILAACGCGDPRYALSKELPQVERYCGINEAFCIQDLANVSMDSECFCFLPCFERLYPTTMTLAKLKLPPDYSDEDRQQSVLLEVYYETFEFVILEEVASYTPLQFLSDMGGTVGNNLGFSFISVAELLFLLALLFGVSHM